MPTSERSQLDNADNYEFLNRGGECTELFLEPKVGEVPVSE
jgi:hypothetical protein